MILDKRKVGKIISLRKAGKSYGDIAEIVGVAKSTVHKVAKDGQVASRRGRLTDADREEAMRMREAGCEFSEIAMRFNCSLSTAHGMVQQRMEAVSRGHIEEVIVAPPFVLAERDRRLSAPVRDLTGLLFGDPRVGYSALERRA